MSADQKSKLRQKIKNIRKTLSKKEVEEKSKQITYNIVTQLFPKIENIKDQKIALYNSANNEVRTDFLIKYLNIELKNNQTALPVINKNNIIFKKYILLDTLNANQTYKNIFEPLENNEEIIPNIIIVPLVACDKNGHRIGMGGGFYDRKIAQLKQNYQNLTIIGLAYNFQIVTEIKPNKFDQTLDFIACESHILECAE